MPKITRRLSARRAPGWFFGKRGSIAVYASFDIQNNAIYRLHHHILCSSASLFQINSLIGFEP
jgi:hypothetical protein